MKKKIYPTIILSVLFVLLLIAGWFYWFQWRPFEIRKECSKERESYIKERFPDIEPSVEEGTKLINLKYERCLTSKGLSK